jgi:GNAT superfamily N-acetyltransferase
VSVVIREMREDEAGAIAAMVRGLARDTGAAVVPKLTGDILLHSRDLIDVVVAEEHGRLFGACLGLMTFSTWRGARGLYVVDLFVEPEARGRNLGLLLLKASARRAAARGATFIKLEVDQSNPDAGRFYARLGFAEKPQDRLHILEQDQFIIFIATGEQT